MFRGISNLTNRTKQAVISDIVLFKDEIKNSVSLLINLSFKHVGRFWNSKQSDIKHKARNIKK
jgi:hypothetical protein